MKYKGFIFLVAACLLLIACNKPISTNLDEFKAKWNDSGNNSAVSWWYLGETNDSYYIKQKWPTKQTIYNLSKQDIEINGIDAFQYKAS